MRERDTDQQRLLNLAERQAPPPPPQKTAADCVAEALEAIERTARKTRTEEQTRICRMIREAVADPTVHHSIDDRIAAAAAAGTIPAEELAKTLAHIRQRRIAGQLQSPGAYWVAITKRLCQRYEIPW